MKVLDVGCGDAKVEGAIGMDIAPLPGVDVVHDLSKFPWPFEENSFDKIYLLNIIEHLNSPIKVMEEVHRLLKKGGEVHIEVVYWNHRHSVSDPQHVTFYNETTWDFFLGKRKTYYTSAVFEMVKLEFIYDKIAKIVFLYQKWLMNLASYFLCNVKQGMIVTLRK
ncbi:hypothetical protein LPTSP4_03080 [Leptospira ryugenii]|uniref:Uncharacterized protein n=1 Tax=Leptospira ryugenii TaxID=1917863 RepID=A0A2P2DVZ2_9LEPT|nr:class I SAM-dependent methyltransferase [Leptospira ryugenii]GBF48808.1 hypothetical protein LPTSP4_03080 [Leptospira ryugenii]